MCHVLLPVEDLQALKMLQKLLHMQHTTCQGSVSKMLETCIKLSDSVACWWPHTCLRLTF